MRALSFALAAALVAYLAAHVTLAVALARRARWTAGLVALLVPPLAPYWGYREGLTRLSLAWIAAFVLYTTLVAVARGAL